MTKRRWIAVIALWLAATLVGSWFAPGKRSTDVTAAPRAVKNARPRKPLDVGHPTFASPHASPIAVHQGLVFVANTPADTLDVIDAKTRKIRTRIHVGVDPVSVAVRPDGKEIWVSNHVSDSVSVIDNEEGSPTYLQVTATIQDFDSKTKATTFDEPMGIAFAGNEKAYIALSSENQIAVVDVASRSIRKRLRIPAQDPRAICGSRRSPVCDSVRIEQQVAALRRRARGHR